MKSHVGKTAATPSSIEEDPHTGLDKHMMLEEGGLETELNKLLDEDREHVVCEEVWR